MKNNNVPCWTQEDRPLPSKTANLAGEGKRNLVDGRHAALRPYRFALWPLLLLLGLSTAAWGQGGCTGSPVIPARQAWPLGADVVVVDDAGNKYLPNEVVFKDTIGAAFFAQRPTSSSYIVEVGLFTLIIEDIYLATGQGFDNPIIGQGAVLNITRVFQDISNLIKDVNPSVPFRTNILIQTNFSSANRGSLFYNPAIISPGIVGFSSGFSTLVRSSNSRIIDNDIFSTIVSGRDVSLANPLTNTPTLLGRKLHGLILMNMGYHNFNYNYSISTNPGQYDFYTVVLHEVLHLLGFSTGVNPNSGNAIGGFYERYDQFLKSGHSGPNIIGNVPSTPYWANTSNITNLNIGCNQPNSLYFQTRNNNDIVVFAPSNFFPGASLSHFSCGSVASDYELPGNTFCIAPGYAGPNGDKRGINTEEIEALCTLGYGIQKRSSPSGDVYNQTFPRTYGFQVPADCDNMYCDAVGDADKYSTPMNLSLNFDPTANDRGTNLNVLEIYLLNPSAGTITRSGTTNTFTFQPAYNFSGNAWILYRLSCSSGAIPTPSASLDVYIQIDVVPPPISPCSISSQCDNLVCGGDFEFLVNDDTRNISDFFISNNYPLPLYITRNLVDVYPFSFFSRVHSPNWLDDSRCSTFLTEPVIPMNTIVPPSSTNGNFLGLNYQPVRANGNSYSGGYFNSAFTLPFAQGQSIKPGHKYEVSFSYRAQCPSYMVLAFSDEAPCPYLNRPDTDAAPIGNHMVGPGPVTTCPNSGGLPYDYQKDEIVSFLVPPSSSVVINGYNVMRDWETISHQFVATDLNTHMVAYPVKAMSVLPEGTTNWYHLFDDFSIKDITGLELDISSTSSPNSLCNNLPRTIVYTITPRLQDVVPGAPVTLLFTVPSGSVLSGARLSNGNTIVLQPGEFANGSAVSFTVVLGAATSGGALPPNAQLVMDLDVPALPNSCASGFHATHSTPFNHVTASNNGPFCINTQANMQLNVTGNGTFSWTGPLGFTSTLQNPTIPANLSVGSHVFSVVVNDGTCAVTSQTTVIVNLPTPIQITPPNTSSVCPNAEIALLADSQSGGAAGTYRWTSNNSFLADGPDLTIGPLLASDNGRQFNVQFTDANGCISNAQFTAQVVNTLVNLPIESTPVLWCEGTQITLSVPSAPQGATYSWSGPGGHSGNQATFVTNPLDMRTTGATYRVLITTPAPTFCQAILSIEPQILPVPTFQLVSSSGSQACSGQAITLSTQPTIQPSIVTKFDWFLDGVQLNAPSQSSLNVTFPNISTLQPNHTYRCLISYVNGCSAESSLTLSGLPFSIQASNNNCVGSDITLGVSNLSPAPSYSFLWTGPNGFSSTLQNPVIPNATIQMAGTYSVQVTNAANCQGFASVNVSVGCLQCATMTSSNIDLFVPGGPNFNVGDLESLNPVLLQGRLFGGNYRTVFLAGDLTIDRDYIFDNVNIVVAPNVRINVLDGATLTLQNNTRIQGCDELWEGIDVRTGGTLIGNESTLRNAFRALTLQPKANADLTGVEFIDNRIGVFTPRSSNGQLYPVNVIQMSGCNFESTQQLLPRNGTAAPRSFAGMELNDLLGLDLNALGTTNQNTFRGMNYGISARNVGVLSVGNATFSDMDAFFSPPSPSVLISNGAAIRTINVTLLRVIGSGESSSSPPMFDHCRTGIHATNSGVAVHHARFEGIHTNGSALYAEGPVGRNILFANNRVNSTANGVWVNNAATSTIDIQNNVLLNTAPSGEGTLLNISGSAQTNRSQVANNLLEIGAGQNGIVFGGEHNINAQCNELRLLSEGSVSGMHLTDVNNSQCNFNNIRGQGPFAANITPGADPSADFANDNIGIILQNNDNVEIQSNNLDDLHTGIMVENNNARVRLRNNQFAIFHSTPIPAPPVNPNPNPVPLPISLSYLSVGIDMAVGAELGIQDRLGNLWREEVFNINGVFAARNRTTDARLAARTMFFVQNRTAFQNPPSNTWPFLPPVGKTIWPNIPPTDFQPWFIAVNPASYFKPTDYPCIMYADPNGGGGGSSSMNLAAEISTAQGNYEGEVYEVEEKWMAEKRLYEKLSEEPSLSLLDPSLDSFRLAQTELAQHKALEEDIKTSVSPAESTVLDWQASETQAMSMLAQAEALLAPFKANQSTPDAQALASYEALVAQAKQILDSVAQYKNTFTGQVYATTEALKDDAGNLPDDKIPAANLQMVREIYLSVFAKGITELSPEDSLTLVSIAQQCPLLGGEAVYEARWLIRPYIPQPNYNDALNCAAQGITKRTRPRAEAGFSMDLSPNPSDDYCMLNIIGALPQEVCTVQVTDAIGKLVYTVTTTNQILELNTSKLVSGLYFVSVIRADGSRATQALNVTR